MAIKKNSKKEVAKRKGTKILIMGVSGAGKSSALLNFPNLMFFDCEQRKSLLFNADEQKAYDNCLFFSETPDYVEVGKDIDAICDNLDGDYATVKTVALDGGATLVKAIMNDLWEFASDREVAKVERIEGVRITKEEASQRDINLAPRDWQTRAKRVETFLYERFTRLASSGINVIVTALEKEVTKQVDINGVPTAVKTGIFYPDLGSSSKDPKAPFAEFDVVLRFHDNNGKKGLDGKKQFIATVIKDLAIKGNEGTDYDLKKVNLYEIYKDRLSNVREFTDANATKIGTNQKEGLYEEEENEAIIKKAMMEEITALIKANGKRKDFTEQFAELDKWKIIETNNISALKKVSNMEIKTFLDNLKDLIKKYK